VPPIPAEPPDDAPEPSQDAAEWRDVERPLHDFIADRPAGAPGVFPPMTVQALLSPTVPALTVGDAVGQALYRMAEHGVEHLPVVGVEGHLAGLVSGEVLRAYPDPDAPLAALPGAEPVSVTPDTHVFDAAHRMLTHGLSVMPVASAEGRYLGLVVRPALFGQLAHMLATEEPGAIVVLEGQRRDFSLAQLAHLIEQNDVRILSVSTEDDPGAGLVRVTLKLNVTDTARVRHLMEHHGYRIIALFDEADADLQGRVDAFLRYLEV
jgi:CBS domain-containing protein